MTRKRFLGIPFSAWQETIATLGVLLAINVFFFDGDRWVGLALHPFWIVVVLVSSQYGTLAGLMSVIASTLALYVGNFPPQSLTETYFDYQFRLCWLPSLWCVTAFLLGELRNGLVRKNQKLERDLQEMHTEADRVVSAYEKLKAAKEYQELSIASQRRSAAALYRTFKYLEELNPAAILRDLDKIVVTALNPKKFSVYANGANGFEAATCFGWEDSDQFLARIPTEHALYKEIAEKHRLVCVVNRQDEKILGGQGLMAAPLIDTTTGQVFGLVKIEAVHFLEFNLPTMEIFKTLCELIGVAYSHARQFKTLTQQAIYGSCKGVYSYSFYVVQRTVYQKLADTSAIPLTQIVLTAFSVTQEREESARQERCLAEFLGSVMEAPAQVFEAHRDRLRFFILLPGVTLERAEHLALQVVEGLQVKTELHGLQCSQKVELLSIASVPTPSPFEISHG